ncbi:MAG: diadenylate cyclase CdaA [Bacteroidota bacterium]|nr:diadenylate cyclase CdaA [Candidatus Kapabacteria bacterium]MDW8219541.1 diadenylate cyclase CdaA [Bacteroidota bacterium]
MIELFRIWFISVTLVDVIDITIVACILYFLYQTVKNTVAVQIFYAIIVILGVYFLTEVFHLRLLNLILRTLGGIWLLAFIVLFSQEIRRVLLLIVRSPIFSIFTRSQMNETIDEITRAAIEMSEKHTGALIVFARSTNIKMTIETGIPLQARLSKELLVSIFNPKSPLHDGAVVIQNGIIEAARCILPLSLTTRFQGKHLGTRHRAAMGISEQADVLVLVISEETGKIALAEEGTFIPGVTPHNLYSVLAERLSGTRFKTQEKELTILVEELRSANLHRTQATNSASASDQEYRSGKKRDILP